MNTIRVKVEALKRKLGENRIQHENDYKLAVEGYLETYLEKLDAARKRILEKEVIQPYEATSGLTYPESHQKEYDRAISMLSWHTEEEIEVDEEEFRQYVLDEWDWTERWKVSNQAYITKSSRR